MAQQERQREGVISGPRPKLEVVWVFGSMASPTGTLSLVFDGKNFMFDLNRRQIFGLMAQCAEALKKMEPGS